MNPLCKTATGRYLRPILFGAKNPGMRFVDGDLGHVQASPAAAAVCFGCGEQIPAVGFVLFGHDQESSGDFFLHLHCAREIGGELLRMADFAARESGINGVLAVGVGEESTGETPPR